MRRFLATILCLLALVPAAHADGVAVRKSVWLRANATISAAGRIEALEWKVPDASRPLAEKIDANVRTWEFEPATVDGVPAGAKTGLNVLVAAQVNDAGGLDLHVLTARVAPLSMFIAPPFYPPQALRDNKEAFVEVTLRVGADGATTVEAVDVRSSGHGAVFEKQVRAAADAWRLEPEVVAGHVVESRVRVPVSFCLPLKRSWCERQRAEGNAPSASGEPVAIEPRVRLRTEVKGLRM